MGSSIYLVIVRASLAVRFARYERLWRVLLHCVRFGRVDASGAKDHGCVKHELEPFQLSTAWPESAGIDPLG